MTSGEKPQDPRLLHTIGLDIGRVMRDVGRRGLRRQLSGTLRDLESFYLSEERRERLAGLKPASKLAHRLLWLLRGLLMKLPPARRVLLALALVLIVVGNATLRFGNVSLNFDFMRPATCCCW